MGQQGLRISCHIMPVSMQYPIVNDSHARRTMAKVRNSLIRLDVEINLLRKMIVFSLKGGIFLE